MIGSHTSNGMREEVVPERTCASSDAVHPGMGVAVVDESGKIVRLNDRAAVLLFGAGSSASKYVGENLNELFPEDWVKDRGEAIQRVFETGEPVLFRSICDGKQIVTWLVRGNASEGTEGCVVAVLQAMAGSEPAQALGVPSEQVMEGEVVDLGPLHPLTPREVEVLALLGEGMSMKEISQELGCSLKTAEKHRGAVGAKLGLDDRVKLARLATFAGLTRRDARRRRIVLTRPMVKPGRGAGAFSNN